MNTALNNNTDLSLLRLMQLSSAALPVGGYSFSQGLEFAIDSEWLSSNKDVEAWIGAVLVESIAKVDLPLLMRLMQALEKKEFAQFHQWNSTVLACRETAELLLTETAMGEALERLLKSLNTQHLDDVLDQPNVKLSFVAGFAIAAHHWSIDTRQAMAGYLWSWLENQVAAATKLVPLGQTTAQQLLISLGENISDILTIAEKIDDADIGSSLPGLSMASSFHEEQYSRLFRS